MLGFFDSLAHSIRKIYSVLFVHKLGYLWTPPALPLLFCVDVIYAMLAERSFPETGCSLGPPSLPRRSADRWMETIKKSASAVTRRARPAGRGGKLPRLNSTHSTQSMLTLIFSIPININRRRRAFSADWRSRTALSSVQGQRLNGIIGLSMNARNCCIILLV